MTATLSDDIALLQRLLGDSLTRAGRTHTLDTIESLIARCAAGEHDSAAETLRDCSLPQIHALLKYATISFHLRNKAEQLEIARINHERERSATADSPRPESIADAIATLKRRGRSLDEVLSTVEQLDIEPTLTAHPTEARRRTLLASQERLASAMHRLHDSAATPAQRQHAQAQIARTIQLMLVTDDVRAERLRVDQEVSNGLYFLTGSIWEVVPRLYRDLDDALRACYPEQTAERPLRLPVFLRYRSWIGGDRDGNPFVTPQVTRDTLARQREAVIELHRREIHQLGGELSISTRQIDVPPELLDSIRAERKADHISEHDEQLYRYEPFRQKTVALEARLRRALAGESEFDAAAFVRELELIERSLIQMGLGDVAREGRLAALLARARTFGFHLAALDVRQHSKVHHAACAELLAAAGVHHEYTSLDENARIQLLSRELENPRPLAAPNAELSEDTLRTLQVFRVIAQAVAHEPASIGSVIISMTHHVSHLLEALLLMKEVGLWSMRNHDVRCPVDLAPLFETVDDLKRAGSLLQELFTNPVYAKHIRARGQFQEVMLGYSDSNKDGGYWISNVQLHDAQATLATICAQHDISLRMFHGRGGSVGRGGGRANRAILAAPPISRSGRIRFTEQGEVITFRYALPELARRHVEQIAHAMILGTATAEHDEGLHTEQLRLMQELAERSMQAYRALIDDPDFWPWYVGISAIPHISKLPIASRPVSRKGKDVDFDGLRAIPWVFAWTQMRYTVPGWFGIGSAFHTVMQEQPQTEETFQNMYRGQELFRTLIDNAQQEMARARLTIAQRYSARANHNDRTTHRMHTTIADEFNRAEQAILTITGQQRLLDNRPVIRDSIDARNPLTDVLNLLQLELMQRHDADPTEQEQELIAANIFLSINGLAAAMQSTG